MGCNLDRANLRIPFLDQKKPAIELDWEGKGQRMRACGFCDAKFLIRGLGALAVALLFVLISDPAQARKIGDWEGVCMAPNWQTGELEPVKETQLSDRPMHPWFARTKRLVDGSWQMDFNIFAILAYKLSKDTQKFIFFHECAHAKLDEASERKADCEGLRLMKQEVGLSKQTIKDIRHAYLLILRTFPTGGPCENEPLTNQEKAEVSSPSSDQAASSMPAPKVVVLSGEKASR